MNRLIFIMLIILGLLNCKAQTIIAVKDFEDYNQDLPNGAYIKDVNNLLNKYVGTWKGVYEGKKYEFRIEKITENNTKLDFKEDKLIIKYKISNSSGIAITNTLNLSDDDVHIIRGDYLANSGGYWLSYYGLNDDCGQNGDIYISIYDNPSTKMKLILKVYGEIGLECTTGEAEQVLPTDWIDLTKQ